MVIIQQYNPLTPFKREDKNVQTEGLPISETTTFSQRSFLWLRFFPLLKFTCPYRASPLALYSFRSFACKSSVHSIAYAQTPENVQG